jgi:hypothetical protein
VSRVRRDFGPARSNEVIEWLAGLELERFGGQDPERVQAALVLAAAGDYDRFLGGVQLFCSDWRDVLVAGGLAHADWRDRLAAELPISGAKRKLRLAD